MKSTKIANYAILPNGKKALTMSVVDDALKKKKTTLWGYLGMLAWVVAIAAFSYFLNPACFLCLIPYPFVLIKTIRRDIRLHGLKYYGIERPCIEKIRVENDEGPDDWQLWFYNKDADYKVAASVEKEYYDATEIGEEFYLVFIKDETPPCLWYRKSEWEFVSDRMSARQG